MNRTLKTVLIVLAAVVVLGGIAVGILKWIISRNILDGPGMVNNDSFDFSGTYLKRVYYYRGGSSLGDSNTLEMTVNELPDGKGEAVVVYTDRPTHDSKEKQKTVKLGPPVVRGVTEIIERYHMTEWKDLPKTDIIALDAPSLSFTYEFSDGSVYRLGSDLEMPDQAYQAVREILQYIKTCAGIRED